MAATGPASPKLKNRSTRQETTRGLTSQARGTGRTCNFRGCSDQHLAPGTFFGPARTLEEMQKVWLGPGRSGWVLVASVPRPSRGPARLLYGPSKARAAQGSGCQEADAGALLPVSLHSCRAPGGATPSGSGGAPRGHRSGPGLLTRGAGRGARHQRRQRVDDDELAVR